MRREMRRSRGNDLRPLESGEEYFPRVFEAVGRTSREVLIETFRYRLYVSSGFSTWRIQSQLIGFLLAFGAISYFLPLAVAATGLYALLKVRLKDFPPNASAV